MIVSFFKPLDVNYTPFFKTFTLFHSFFSLFFIKSIEVWQRRGLLTCDIGMMEYIILTL